nr:non-muscle caldesmon-like [Nerophis lumbriciformis]
MSNALLRRNSSKQGLQNLIRLTAQRSVEDAEEVERERRRRAREEVYRRNDDAAPADYASNQTDNDDTFQGVVKPRSSPSLEEDEGFSDWTQRRQQKRQQRLEEVAKGERLHSKKDEHDRDTYRAPSEDTSASSSTSSSSSTRVLIPKTDDTATHHQSQAEERQRGKGSQTSKVFLFQDYKHDGDTAQQEVTSYSSKQPKSRSPRCNEQGEAEAIVEAERRMEKIRLGLQEKECHELEQLKHRQAQAEHELEELTRRRELRRRLRSEEEQRQQVDERQRATKEEEEHRRMKEDIERRRVEAAVRMKSLSGSSGDTDKTFSPIKTPTHKITERTESLNRSLKKSNSFKKTSAIVLVSNIDDKMEQYAHAVENSQEPRGLKTSMADLPNSLEVVTSKKNLFEAGEVQTSPSPKTTSCRDTDGLKVGVANLINQWVKGQPNTGRPTQSQVADVKYGDVMQKKNMWEVIGDSSGRSATDIKGSAAVNKKFRFVVTGHGKYEKISVDQEHDANTKSEVKLEI